MHKASLGLFSISAWLVASALQECGTAANISEKTAFFPNVKISCNITDLVMRNDHVTR